MKNISKKAFTLIEIIVATSILTIAVFWVFKLIWENNKIMSTSQNIKNSHFLLQPMSECLESIGISQLQSEWNQIYIDLWVHKNKCSIWNSNTFVELNNLDYQLLAEKKSYNWDSIVWDLKISDWVNKDIIVEFFQK